MDNPDLETTNACANALSSGEASSAPCRQIPGWLSRIFEEGAELIAIVDRYCNYQYNSPSYEQILGYPIAELQKICGFDLLHPEDRQLIESEFSALQQHKAMYSSPYRIRKKDGNYVWLKTRAVNLLDHPEIQGMVLAGLNITAEMEARQQLEQSERSYKQLFECNPVPMYVWDFETKKILDANAAVLAVLGYNHEELLQLSIFDLGIPEEFERLEKVVQHELTFNEVFREMNCETWRLRRKNGEIIYTEHHGHIIDYKQRRAALVRVADITSKVMVERALSESEERHKALFWESPIPKWICSIEEKKIIEVNQAALNFYGYSYEEFLVKPPHHFCSIYMQADASNDFFAEEAEMMKEVVHEQTRKDGSQCFVEMSSSKIHLEGKSALIVAAIDVTSKIRQHRIDELERDIIRSVIRNSEQPLSLFRSYLSGLQAEMPGYHFSVMKVENGAMVRYVAPSLPAGFHKAFDSNMFEINSLASDEVEAKDFSNNQVESATDSVTTTQNEIAASQHFYNCRSFPIKSANEIVIATLACYYPKQTLSSYETTDLLKRAASVLGLLMEYTQAQQELKLSHERYYLATAAAFDSIWDWDVQQGTVVINETYQNIYGKLPENQPGTIALIQDHLHPDERAQVLESANKAIKSGENIWTAEHRYLNKKGQYSFVLTRAFLVRNNKGRLVRMVGAMQDIQEKKDRELQLENLLSELKENNERFKLVNLSANEAIYDYDSITDTLILGEGYLRIFGHNPESHRHLPHFKAHIHPDDKLDFIRSRRAAFNNADQTIWEKECRYATADNQYLTVLVRGYLVRNSKGIVTRMVGTIADITYRKQYEILLQQLNEDLKIQATELARSNAELEQFAYVASHDLQEPLRMVSSFVSQLDRKYGNQLDDKARQFIHFAVDGANRMRAIIMDLLEYSRVGKHNDQKTPIDLNLVVQDVCLLQQLLINEKKASIIAADLPVITSFKTPISQILYNLITNALKYSKPEVAPIIKIEVEEFIQHWTISVSDNGIGISKEYHEKIFVLFQRLHLRENFGGTGIGLAMVKKAVENIGGKIYLDSTPNIGSTFYFTIPK